MNYKDIFPKRLQEARTFKKFTQDEIAIILDISRPSYTQYEIGRNFPKFETLIKISIALDVSIDYLVGLSNERNFKK